MTTMAPMMIAHEISILILPYLSLKAMKIPTAIPTNTKTPTMRITENDIISLFLCKLLIATFHLNGNLGNLRRLRFL